MSSQSLQMNHLSMCGHGQGLWPGTMHKISEIIALHTLVSPDPKLVASLPQRKCLFPGHWAHHLYNVTLGLLPAECGNGWPVCCNQVGKCRCNRALLPSNGENHSKTAWGMQDPDHCCGKRSWSNKDKRKNCHSILPLFPSSFSLSLFPDILCMLGPQNPTVLQIHSEVKHSPGPPRTLCPQRRKGQLFIILYHLAM